MVPFNRGRKISRLVQTFFLDPKETAAHTNHWVFAGAKLVREAGGGKRLGEVEKGDVAKELAQTVSGRGEMSSMRAIAHAELDEALMQLGDLRGYLDRIASEAFEAKVTVKATDEAPAVEHGIDQVFDLLARGAIYGVQLEYVFQRQRWLDTLIATSRGIRLVRVRPGRRHNSTTT
jgi:hypothetical protein